jgi:hypothetical protein
MNLDNVINITGDVLSILKRIKDPDMQEMKNKDFFAYSILVESEYPNFASKYYNLLQKLLKHEDISHFYEMINTICKISTDEISQKEGEEKLGNTLTKKYVYPSMSS